MAGRYRPGRAPQTAKREQYAALIAGGVTYSEACRPTRVGGQIRFEKCGALDQGSVTSVRQSPVGWLDASSRHVR
jgi:hypothetical protein